MGVEPVGETCAKKPLATISRENRAAATDSLWLALSARRPCVARAALMRHSRTLRARGRPSVMGSVAAPGHAVAAAVARIGSGGSGGNGSVGTVGTVGTPG